MHFSFQKKKKTGGGEKRMQEKYEIDLFLKEKNSNNIDISVLHCFLPSLGLCVSHHLQPSPVFAVSNGARPLETIRLE